jgi:hypothetical protein
MQLFITIKYGNYSNMLQLDTLSYLQQIQPEGGLTFQAGTCCCNCDI